MFVTWRLAGTLPAALIASLRRSQLSARRRFAVADKFLDRGATGPQWLDQPRVATIVRDSILRGDAQLRQYGLIAYVVMPNHVHLLIEPPLPLSRILRGIKGTTAQAANRALNRVGLPFWQDESFDHWVRSGAETEKIIRYIEHNPVEAGLVRAAADWRWSSASEAVAQALLSVRVGSSKADAVIP